MANVVHRSSYDKNYTLSTQITKLDTCCERGELYTVYVISVTKHNNDGSQEVWEVIREYSDFEHLHSKITERYDYLPQFDVPTKTIFQKTSKEFLEKRRLHVNGYLHNLLNPSFLRPHKGLLEYIAKFLQHRLCNRQRNSRDSKEILLPSDEAQSVNIITNLLCNASLTSSYALMTQISRTDTCCRRSSSTAVYVIQVTKRNSDGSEEVWDVLRGYRDFKDLHTKILAQYGNLPDFPLSRVLEKISVTKREFLEKGRLGVNAYLHNLLNPSLLDIHGRLLQHIFNFLQDEVWAQQKFALSREAKQGTTVFYDKPASADQVQNPLETMLPKPGTAMFYDKLASDDQVQNPLETESMKASVLPCKRLVQNCSCTRNSSLTTQIRNTEDLAFYCDTFPTAHGIITHMREGSCTNKYILDARITNTDTYCGLCKSHDVYVIQVIKHNSNGSKQMWDVLREYSDFKCLHKILKQYGNLPGLVLPRPFNKTNKAFLEKRKSDFDAYLQALLSSSSFSRHEGLQELAFNFLEHRVWNPEKYPLDREIMMLERFKRTISVHNANPLTVAEFWIDVLDNHIEEVLGCSMDTFVNNNTEAVEGLGECVKYLVKVYKDCGIATTSAGSVSVLAGGLTIGGLALAPFTAGGSLGCTLAGVSLGAVAGVTSAGTGLTKRGIEYTKLKKINQMTQKAVTNIHTLQELFTTCVDAFKEAHEYLNTDKGRNYSQSVARVCENINVVSHNALTRNIHSHAHSPQITKRSFRIKDALQISTAGALPVALRIWKESSSLAKSATYDTAIAVQRTARIIKFFNSGSFAQVGIGGGHAVGLSADGFAIGGRTLIRMGSEAAQVFTVAFGALEIGLGIMDIVTGANDIRNPTEALRGLHEFASQLEDSTKELHDLYEKLTDTPNTKL